MSRHGLGVLAQPGRLVHRFADHGVFESLLGADVAGHHLTGGHSDPGVQFGHLAAQPGGDGPRRGQGLVLGVRQGDGRAEHRQHGVTLELVE